MSYARFVRPHRRLKPITPRQNPQVSIGLHLRGGSADQILRSHLAYIRGAGHVVRDSHAHWYNYRGQVNDSSRRA